MVRQLRNRQTFTSDSYTGGSVPAKFDAFLYKPTHLGSQLKLTIKLRINLRQLPPKPISLALDADGNPFWTLPWSSVGWAAFISAAAAQADMWNNKFWLLPPASFSGFDEVYELDPFLNTFPNKVFRPNIRCALDVDFAATDDAHLTIDVAILNTGMLVLQGSPLNAGTFCSHALLYDSLDAVPWAFPYGPGPSPPTVHYVIVGRRRQAAGSPQRRVGAPSLCPRRTAMALA